MDASGVFAAMLAAINVTWYKRWSSDPTSPMQDMTSEASPGEQFVLSLAALNVPRQRKLNLPWAVANVLHFFADTEDATPLVRYNDRVQRFAPGGKWPGAYGAIAMPQIRRCITMLKANFDTRRAFVSMGENEPQDINRPACWNMLHFLTVRGRLDMLCYQRSLNLYGVMPYDCIVLSNILRFVAEATGLLPGSIRWTIGSLHMRTDEPQWADSTAQPDSILLPLAVLGSPDMCWGWLVHPEKAQEPFRSYLNA